MARRIIAAAFVSLDGVMQAPGGPTEDQTGGFAHGGWLWPVTDEAIDQQVGALFAGEFDLLLGRRTYDIFAAYWPYVPADNPIAAKFAAARKYVLTGSEAPLEWEGSERLGDVAAVAALKAGSGPDLVIQGSSTLYPQLVARGLIDRLTLMIAPVTIGSGKRLFGEAMPGATWKLVEQRTGTNGTIVATFEPAGPLETGTFAEQEPSERELRRQRAIAEGTW